MTRCLAAVVVLCLLCGSTCQVRVPALLVVPLPELGPIDSDGDGLTDEQENLLLTDIWSRDSDDDGLSDFDEVETHGTNPLLPDTDQDELDDGAEVGGGLGTDPLDPDSDGDGREDGLEIQLGLDPMFPNPAGRVSRVLCDRFAVVESFCAAPCVYEACSSSGQCDSGFDSGISAGDTVVETADRAIRVFPVFGPPFSATRLGAGPLSADQQGRIDRFETDFNTLARRIVLDTGSSWVLVSGEVQNWQVGDRTLVVTRTVDGVLVLNLLNQETCERVTVSGG